MTLFRKMFMNAWKTWCNSLQYLSTIQIPRTIVRISLRDSHCIEIQFIPFPKPDRQVERSRRLIRLCGRPHFHLNERIFKKRGKRNIYVFKESVISLVTLIYKLPPPFKLDIEKITYVHLTRKLIKNIYSLMKTIVPR